MTPATVGFSNTVRFYKATGSGNTAGDRPFQIDWEVKVGSGSFMPIGSTKHTVYVTAADPIGDALNRRLETVFSLACRRANMIAIDIEDRIPEAIWSEFTDRHVEKVVPSTGDTDGIPMMYYGNTADTIPSAGAIAGTPSDCGASTSELLSLRNGVCNAWADFFRDLLAVHGITGINRGLDPKYTPESGLIAALNQKYGSTWSQAPSTASTLYLFVKNQDVTDPLSPTPQSGLPAQGNLDPTSYFQSHAVIEHNGMFYDPSDGAGPFYTQIQMENAELAGVGRDYWIQLNGNPNPIRVFWFGAANALTSEELNMTGGGQP